MHTVAWVVNSIQTFKDIAIAGNAYTIFDVIRPVNKNVNKWRTSLSPSITAPSAFHSRLKTHLFHKSLSS